MTEGKGNILKAYAINDSNTISPHVGITVVPNEPLAKSMGHIQWTYRPLKSHNALSVWIALEGKSEDGTTVKQASREVLIPAQFVLRRIDWEYVAYMSFEIMGIILIFVKLFVVLVRPFLPEYTKLKMIWIGQAIIYYDLLSYTGLIKGNFRNTIDEF